MKKIILLTTALLSSVSVYGACNSTLDLGCRCQHPIINSEGKLACGEDYCSKLAEAFASAQVNSGTKTDCTHLGYHHGEKTLGYHISGEHPYKEVEGAAQIVADNAHEFARKVSAPGVEDAFLACENIVHIVIVVYILSIKVKRQYRFFSERVGVFFSSALAVFDGKGYNGENENE